MVRNFAAAPPPNGSLSRESARQIYVNLVRCRLFDEKIVELYPEQEMRCPTHLSVGQEALPSGVCAALRANDVVFSTHRSHSHSIAKGADFKPLMAELYGKRTGCCKGKGGSMHFLAPEVGVLGSSAIVGGSLPLAAGAALAAVMNGQDKVAVAFFGDAAIEQGTFHESLNFASLRKLPVIFACENNDIATCTPLSSRQPFAEIFRRAEAYDMPGVRVDGTKAEECFFAAEAAVKRARAGEGPTLIEAVCYRWREHVGPKFDYSLGHRTKEELDAWMQKDPIKFFEKYAAEKGLMAEKDFRSLTETIQKDLEAAVKFGKESPFPDPEELYQDI